MTTPAIGTFLKPVARSPRCYCMRVDGVTREAWYDETDLHEFLRCTRFGLDDAGQPLEDGHQTASHLRDLFEIRPGVWRAPDATWGGATRYWRAIELRGARGQMEMFS